MSKYERTVFGPIKYACENSLLEGKPILSLIYEGYHEDSKNFKFKKEYILKCVENYGGFNNGWCNFKDCWVVDPNYIVGTKSPVYYLKYSPGPSTSNDLLEKYKVEIQYLNNMKEINFRISNNNNIENYNDEN